MCIFPSMPKVELPPAPPPPAPVPNVTISKVAAPTKVKKPSLRGSPSATLTIQAPQVVPTTPTNVTGMG